MVLLCYSRSMSNRPWEIYSLTDPRTLEVRYIGVTFRGKARLCEHISRAARGGKTHRDCWLRSLIAAGLRPIHGTMERGSGDGWPEREQFWIATHKATLTNHTDGGEGSPGYVPTPELRRKWSALRLGVPYAFGRRAAMMGRKPVRCVETGETFASVTEAARHLDVTETSVYQSIRKGCRCRGNHYRLV